MSMCSCRLFGELGIRSEELGMFVGGGGFVSGVGYSTLDRVVV